MALETYEVFDVPIPADPDVASKIAAGNEVEYWVILGRYKINRVKG